MVKLYLFLIKLPQVFLSKLCRKTEIGFNKRQWRYGNIHFFLGFYPILKKVQEISKKHDFLVALTEYKTLKKAPMKFTFKVF